MTMFCSGGHETENIWLTDQWGPADVDELAEMLFEMYWPADDPPDWMRDDEYADRLHALAVTLLVNREEGVTQEVRELCNNFTPRSLPKDSPAAVFAACPPRHSLIWQPAPQEDLPSWLTAAVAGLNPGRAGEAVRRQARTIHEDPALMAWLRALLTVPA